MKLKNNLFALFQAAIDAADPTTCLKPYLPDPSEFARGDLVVVGAGKASLAMAQAVEEAYLPLGLNLRGIVITPHGTAKPLQKIKCLAANHPVPDAAGSLASQSILDLARSLKADDTLMCLISGGGSALMSLPTEGLSLEDKQALNQALLRSGASIDEINCVRKHVSATKGGRLAAAAFPARLITYLVSDVPGDDVQIIASGPTVQNLTSLKQARAIVEKYGLKLSPALERVLADEASQTPRLPKDLRQDIHMIARPQQSLEVAAKLAKDLGYTPLILGDALEGEARTLGEVLAGITKQVLRHDQPAKAPLAILSGGETSVTLSAKSGKWGKGGRNAETLLGFLIAMQNEPSNFRARVSTLFGDTDGKDGSEDNAGAFWLDSFYNVAADRDLRPQDFLAKNDAYSFFKACNALVETGPTYTNVNDFRAILIENP